jgi:hypothetical protein
MKKEDKLEQFVKNNALDFNSLEPPVMAWDSIEKELPVSKQVPVGKILPYAWKAAAAILIFASAWLLNDYLDYKKSSNDSASASAGVVTPELTELSDAEAYYTSQISSKQVELAAYAKEHPEIIEDLKKEFSEMDKSKAELKKDLAESNADEKVIEAIIMSYRVKLEILDQMLTELRKSKEGNENQKTVEINL